MLKLPQLMDFFLIKMLLNYYGWERWSWENYFLKFPPLPNLVFKIKTYKNDEEHMEHSYILQLELLTANVLPYLLSFLFS